MQTQQLWRMPVLQVRLVAAVLALAAAGVVEALVLWELLGTAAELPALAEAAAVLCCSAAGCEFAVSAVQLSPQAVSLALWVVALAVVIPFAECFGTARPVAAVAVTFPVVLAAHACVSVVASAVLPAVLETVSTVLPAPAVLDVGSLVACAVHPAGAVVSLLVHAGLLGVPAVMAALAVRAVPKLGLLALAEAAQGSGLALAVGFALLMLSAPLVVPVLEHGQ